MRALLLLLLPGVLFAQLGSNGGGSMARAKPPFRKDVTSTSTTLTIGPTEHGQGTDGLLVGCYDASSPRNKMPEPAAGSAPATGQCRIQTASDGTVTVTFASGGNNGGRVIVNGGGVPGATGATGAQGLQGLQGPTGQGLTRRGAYSSGTAYAAYDFATYQGETWVAIASSTGTTPGTDGGTKWERMAAKGADGATGAQGAAGATGSQGPAGQGFTFRNSWNSATAYSAYDVVTYGGESWNAVASSTNVTPGTDGSKWAKFAAKGADGTGGGSTAPATPGLVASDGAALQPAGSSDITSTLGYTPLRPSNNLSDIGSASTARTNLGLGTAATQASSAFDAAGAASTAQAASLQKSSNLSDITNAATARTNLGLGSAATQPSSAFDAAGAASTAQAASLQKSSNLSDVGNAATARTNLGLGTAATQPSSAFDAAGAANTVQSNLTTHASDTTNPHQVTKAQVGLGNVPNTDATNASNIGSGTLADARLSTSVQGAATAVAGASSTGAANKLVKYDNNGVIQSTAPQPFTSSTPATSHTFANPFLNANVVVQDLKDLSGNPLVGYTCTAGTSTITCDVGISTAIQGIIVGAANGPSGAVDWSAITSKPSTFTPSAHTHATSDLTTRSGNGVSVVTTTGTQTAGRCVEIDANGNHVAAAAACGTGTGSSGPVDVPDLNFFKITRTSATQFTIAPGVCGLGSNPARFTTTMTVTMTGTGDGEAAVYCDPTPQTPALKVQLRKASANTLALSCSGGCTSETGTATPTDGIEFGKVSIQSGAFPSTGGVTDERGLGIVGAPTRAGSGLEEEIINGQRYIKPPTAAITGTIVVKGSNGSNCNLVLTSGFITGTTCP